MITETPLIVTFQNARVLQYVLDFLESDQHPVVWKYANMHNSALQSLSTAIIAVSEKKEDIK